MGHLRRVALPLEVKPLDLFLACCHMAACRGGGQRHTVLIPSGITKEGMEQGMAEGVGRSDYLAGVHVYDFREIDTPVLMEM